MLSDEQLALVIQWLNEHFPGGYHCPACQHVGHKIGNVVGAPTLSQDWQGFALPGPLLPMVQVTCQRCRFVSHFEAAPMGLKPTTP